MTGDAVPWRDESSAGADGAQITTDPPPCDEHNSATIAGTPRAACAVRTSDGSSVLATIAAQAIHAAHRVCLRPGNMAGV